MKFSDAPFIMFPTSRATNATPKSTLNGAFDMFSAQRLQELHRLLQVQVPAARIVRMPPLLPSTSSAMDKLVEETSTTKAATTGGATSSLAAPPQFKLRPLTPPPALLGEKRRPRSNSHPLDASAQKRRKLVSSNEMMACRHTRYTGRETQLVELSKANKDRGLTNEEVLAKVEASRLHPTTSKTRIIWALRAPPPMTFHVPQHPTTPRLD